MSDDAATPFPGSRDGLVGNGRVLAPDDLLEANKGDFVELVIIGRRADGKVAVGASHDGPRALWLIERGRHFLLHDTGWDPTP